jgi:hypothetical protein
MNEQANLLKQTLARLQQYVEASLQQEWVELRLKLLALIDEMEREPTRFPIIRAQLLLLLQDHPDLFTVAREWLRGSLAEVEFAATRSYTPSKGVEPALESLSVAADATPTVTRYTDIELPAQVQVAHRFPLIVGLTVAPSPDSADAQPLEAPLGAQIHCMVTPGPGLVVLDKRMQPLTVADADSPPVVFYLRATAAGDHQLQIDFWYDGQIIASSTQGIQAVDAAVTTQATHRAGPPLLAPSATAPYPDLVIRISTLQNQLRYDLTFGDLTFLSFQGEPLRSNPEQFRYELLQEIEALGEMRDAGDDFVLRELTKLGQTLYRELWPVELRREYRRFRKTVQTIQIISDEPWLPWELIKPYDDEDPADPVDDDFLALQFDLARWFTPALAPAATILIDSVACIAPTDSGLPAAQQELTLLQRLALARQLPDYTPATPDKATVEALLTSGEPIRLWHFACHGDFDAAAPGQSPLLMQGAGAVGAVAARGGERPVKLVGVTGGSTNRSAARRHQLRPDDFVGPVTTRLKRDRPFVFLNACRVGSGGMGLTGVGGWAKVLVADCGVGALLAPLWTINDQYAQEFATYFYAALATEGTTVAAATRAARLELRQRYPNDPLWLAYSLYAHPNARVALLRQG